LGQGKHGRADVKTNSSIFFKLQESRGAFGSEANQTKLISVSQVDKHREQFFINERAAFVP
jgi:hypothetical protein